MVREQPSLGFDDENPYHHPREFEQLCSCLTISSMEKDTLRWNLFPFSLDERVKQWYAHNVGKVNGEWDELRDRFCLAFSLFLKSLPYEKRSSTFIRTRRRP
jgi:hypothetical protein